LHFLCAGESNVAAISKLVRGDTQMVDGGHLPPESSNSSRLETVGRLASGIAHDFANILTLISGYTEILLARTESGGGGRAELEEIRRASNRAATLIAQLLQFAGKQTAKPKPIDLNALVADVEAMLRPIIGERVEVRLNLAAGRRQVLADPIEMDQVVMNLLLNARDAMPGGGRITVETMDGVLDDAEASTLEMAAGACVKLRISDTGQGIDPAVMPHLFDPFFTTKPAGKGAGLGLNTVRQLVRRRGGAVWATSEPGEGAAFHVCLPAVRDACETTDETRDGQPPKRGSETVLVVEDEEGVRRLLTQVLRMRGYQVLEAADGEQALDLFREDGARIQLVLTDVIMPRMGGAELAERLRALRPGLPLILMSGYPDTQISTAGVLRASRWFLRKPLTPHALASAVREALDSPSRPFNPR
jgi:two-component system, cell cycle sensor histidine kinase and response regulator CckA